MAIPTESIGSVPRPPALVEALTEGRADALPALLEAALKDTLEALEATRSPVLTEGERSEPSFVALDNRVHDRVSEEERARIGVHTGPGGDHDSTHRADVEYADLLPDLVARGCAHFSSRARRIIAAPMWSGGRSG